jgi:hypothetical protein
MARAARIRRGGTAVAECAAEEGAVSSHATFAVLAAACAFGALGCEATFTPVEPVFSVSGGLVVRATSVPPDVWSYPRVYYDGGYVYLVNGLWYELTPQGCRRRPWRVPLSAGSPGTGPRCSGEPVLAGIAGDRFPLA